jgi:hypothetical protein
MLRNVTISGEIRNNSRFFMGFKRAISYLDKLIGLIMKNKQKLLKDCDYAERA